MKNNEKTEHMCQTNKLKISYAKTIYKTKTVSWEKQDR